MHRPPGRRNWSLLLVLVLLVVAGATAEVFAAGPSPERADGAGAPDVRLVTVADDGPRLWPFTSRAREFDTLTLPVNVVVEGQPTRVRHLLVTGRDAEWTDQSPDAGRERVSSGEARAWSRATGATRYTYVHDGGDGEWQTEAFQLHDGTYFGSRVHLRLYGGSKSSWTAIQAHRDYWDWFRLRHTVTGLSGPQHQLERELAPNPAVTRVTRERYANGGVLDADGWVTVVELADTGTDGPTEDRSAADPSGQPPSVELPPSDFGPLPWPLAPVVGLLVLGVAGVVSPGRWRDVLPGRLERLGNTRLADRRLHRVALLVGVLFCFPLAVRGAGLALETVLPRDPKVVAGLLYPVFALGPPLLVARIASDLDAATWFTAAFVGYGSGLVVDLGVIGVQVLPVHVVLHRFAVLVALGAVAVVGYRRSTGGSVPRTERAGVAVLWLGALAWPLVSYFL